MTSEQRKSQALAVVLQAVAFGLVHGYLASPITAISIPRAARRLNDIERQSCTQCLTLTTVPPCHQGSADNTAILAQREHQAYEQTRRGICSWYNRGNRSSFWRADSVRKCRRAFSANGSRDQRMGRRRRSSCGRVDPVARAMEPGEFESVRSKWEGLQPSLCVGGGDRRTDSQSDSERCAGSGRLSDDEV
jgi:hypothetical protein